MTERIEPKYQYDAFLSYATEADYDLARDVEDFLERFHELPTPSEMSLRALSIWRDGSDASIADAGGGADVSGLLELHLASSRYLVLLWSERSRESRWMRFELEWFLRNRERGSVLLAITDAHDPRPDSVELFLPEIVDAGVTGRPWYDFRGFQAERVAGALRVRDYDEARVQLAADLNGYRPADVQPLWWRNKIREQQERAEREERARMRLELTECDARLKAAEGWYERAVTAFQRRRYGAASRYLAEALAIGDPAGVPDRYPRTLVDPGWAEGAWAFLRYVLAFAPRVEDAPLELELSGWRRLDGLAWVDGGCRAAVLREGVLELHHLDGGGHEIVFAPSDETGPITAWACARASDFVVAGTEEGTVIAWSGASGRTDLRAPSGVAVTAVAVTADGRGVAVGGADGEIRHRVPPGRDVTVREADGTRVEHVSFVHADSALLIRAGSRIFTQQLSDGEAAPLHDFATTGSLVSDDEGARYAFSDWDIVQRSDLSAPDDRVLYVGEHLTPVDEIAFAAGGDALFTRDLEAVCVWLGRERPLQRGQSFMGARMTQTFGLSNRGSLLKTVEELGRIDRIATHPRDPGRFLVARGGSVERCELGFRFQPAVRHGGPPSRRAIWVPDAGAVVAGGEDGSVTLLPRDSERADLTLARLEAAVGDVALSRDGRTVAAVAENGRVCVIPASGGGVLGEVVVHALPFAVAFASDEVAVGCVDGSILLWDWQRGTPPRRLASCDGCVRRIDVAGRILVTGMDTGEVAAWDLEKELPLWSTADHAGSRYTGGVAGVSISPDGSVVACACLHGAVWCLETAGGRELSWTPIRGSVAGKPEQVTAIGMCDDGRTAVAGLWDGTLCVVDLKLSRELLRFPAHTKVLTSAEHAPGTGLVVTASIDDDPDNDAVRVWELLDVATVPPPGASCDDWAQAARAAVRRRSGARPDSSEEPEPRAVDEAQERLTTLRAALLDDPDTPERSLELAIALLDAGRPGPAKQCLTRAHRLGGANLIRDSRATALLAVALLEESSTADALPWLRRAANENEPEALMQLGVLHLHGEGVPYDEEQGVAHLRESADLGHPVAAHNLGAYHEHYAVGAGRTTDWRMLAFGEPGGEEPHLAEALRWYRQAADAGYEPAFDALARLERE